MYNITNCPHIPNHVTRLIKSSWTYIFNSTHYSNSYFNFDVFHFMSRHQFDLVQCMKQTGSETGLVCPQCDGRCPSCDSLVKPTTRARICAECSLGHLVNKCILCGNNTSEGTPAYYCLECVRMEKDREGCPRILNMGSSRTEVAFRKKK